MREIYTKWITLRNGVRLHAEQVGLKAFRFVVTEEEHQAYLKRKQRKGQD
jgi:hypothetical protein